MAHRFPVVSSVKYKVKWDGAAGEGVCISSSSLGVENIDDGTVSGGFKLSHCNGQMDVDGNPSLDSVDENAIVVSVDDSIENIITFTDVNNKNITFECSNQTTTTELLIGWF